MEQLLVTVPAAAALIILTREFLKHIASQRRLDRELWSNHMGKSIEAQVKSTTILDRLVDEVRGVRERL